MTCELARDDSAIAFAEVSLDFSAFDDNHTIELKEVYDTLPNQSLRLLSILPESTSTKIYCELVQNELRPGLEYTALSYAWGAKPNTHTISIKGKKVPVRKNLWRFLSRARHLMPHKRLWIDALCINQTNFEERRDQVSIMPQIYSFATEVLVWLGPSYGGSDEAMRYIAAGSLKTKKNADIRASTAGAFIGNLCWRSYWRRLWIVQEIMFARRVILTCGDKTAPWEPFQGILLQIVERQSHSTLPNSCHSRRDHSVEYQLVRTSSAAAIASQAAQGRNQTVLYQLMLATQELNCAERRDKVYALLGLARGTGPEITADYTLPIAVLLNQVLKDLHQHQTPESIGEVEDQCRSLTTLLAVERHTIFELTERCEPRIATSGEKTIKEAFTSSDPSVALWWAVFYSHGLIQQLLLRSNKDYFDWLDKAVATGQNMAVELVLRAMSALSSRDRQDSLDKALELACQNGCSAIANTLLQHGAHANGAHYYGKREGRPLLYASERGQKDLANTLLDKGADVNLAADFPNTYRSILDKRTALDVAVSKGDNEMVKMLIYRGAKLHYVYMRGNGCVGAVQEAMENRHDEVMFTLLDPSMNVLDQGTYDILIGACRCGNAKIVQRLIQLEAKEEAWKNALTISSMYGQGHLVDMLLQDAAYIDIPSSTWASALKGAAMWGHDVTLDRLIEAGAMEDAQNGNVALQTAVFHGRQRTIEMLIKNGANVNAPASENYRTPIQEAAQRGSREIFEMLVRAGADVNYERRHNADIRHSR